MQESTRFKLIEELLSKSSAKDWDRARCEWVLTNVWKEAGGTCVCGKEDIVHHSQLTNKYTSENLVVGSCCVRKVMDLRPDLVLTGLMKIKEGGNMNDEAIEFAFDNNWINDFERDFCLDVKRKRSFSQKQQALIFKINQKVLKAWDTQNPLKSINAQLQHEQDDIMPFGKYKGRLLIEIIPQDKSYFSWLVASSNSASIVLKKKISEILLDIV